MIELLTSIGLWFAVFTVCFQPVGGEAICSVYPYKAILFRNAEVCKDTGLILSHELVNAIMEKYIEQGNMIIGGEKFEVTFMCKPTMGVDGGRYNT